VHVAVDEPGHYAQPARVENNGVVGSAQRATDLDDATVDREDVVALEPAGGPTALKKTVVENVAGADDQRKELYTRCAGSARSLKSNHA
jgi:hypothetical protein